jgi:hypothetical protein
MITATTAPEVGVTFYFCSQKKDKGWLSPHFKSFRVVTMNWLTVMEYLCQK